MISPLAYIHPEAKIGENVEIAPFVFIDKNVVIGDNNKIMANASILYGARIGNGNTIFPGAVKGWEKNLFFFMRICKLAHITSVAQKRGQERGS